MIEEAHPQRWCLACNTEEEAIEEAVLSVQGVVWQNDLPPFSKERCLSK
jgi:hypothetical protein